VKPDAAESHYVVVSRIAIVVLTIFSLWIAKTFLTTISGAWEFIINASAGLGAVLILRWWWWRINAWLHTFYRRVHPGGPGWKAIEQELPDVKGDSGFGALFIRSAGFLVL